MADKYKSMYKYELAAAAGVSHRTLARWLKTAPNSLKLKKMGVGPRTKMLPPKAVDYVCHEYGIEL